MSSPGKQLLVPSAGFLLLLSLISFAEAYKKVSFGYFRITEVKLSKYRYLCTADPVTITDLHHEFTGELSARASEYGRLNKFRYI